MGLGAGGLGVQGLRAGYRDCMLHWGRFSVISLLSTGKSASQVIV